MDQITKTKLFEALCLVRHYWTVQSNIRQETSENKDMLKISLNKTDRCLNSFIVVQEIFEISSENNCRKNIKVF